MPKITSEYLRIKDELLKVVKRKELRKAIMNFRFTGEELRQIRDFILKNKSKNKKKSKTEQSNLF